MDEVSTDLPGAVSWFRYVPHRRVAIYRLVGWTVEPTAPSHHDRFSVLMRYGGPCGDRPPEPARGARIRVIPRHTSPPPRGWPGGGRRRGPGMGPSAPEGAKPGLIPAAAAAGPQRQHEPKNPRVLSLPASVDGDSATVVGV